MDIFGLSILILFILLMALASVMFIGKYAPFKNLELQVTRAFHSECYQDVIALVEASKGKRLSAPTLLAAARCYARTGSYKKSMDSYDSLLKTLPLKSPMRLTALRERGDLGMLSGDRGLAKESYLLGLESAPSDVFLQYKYANFLSTNGDFVQARLILRKLLKDNPMLADARILYAEVLANLGFYSKAIQHFGMMDRAGEKIVSYAYAKTLKELKIVDRALGAYRSLLKKNIDPSRRRDMILDCANLYLQTRHFPEALVFIEDFLPSISDEEGQRELRYVRAELHSKTGDEYLAMQEFARLFDESPNYRDLEMIIKRGGSVLESPRFKEYFTSDERLFEQTVLGITPAGTIIVKRSFNYFLCYFDRKAYVFYRHIGPPPSRLPEELDAWVPQLCSRVTALELWSLNPFDDPQPSPDRKDFNLRPRSGKNLGKLLAGEYLERPVFSRL